jgi:uncharacterized protein (TIGR02246 family)
MSDAIKELIKCYNDAINKSDIAQTVGAYASDGILMPQGNPLSQGHEQLSTAYNGLFALFQLQVTYMIDEVLTNGDQAVVRTHSQGSTLIKTAGTTIQVDNKELFILRKEQGKWKITHYVFNNNARN